MKKKKLTVALAGNANVGKTVIFNDLTGLHQHIGNWPGKTIEKAEGTLRFEGREVDVIDLPGIYSLSTFSQEEVVSREYIAKEKPDVVVNVIDASVLERNLFLTLQLLEMEAPLVIALNMADAAERKGITIDSKKLSKILGVPVVKTIATRDVGIKELMNAVASVAEKKRKKRQFKPSYCKPIERAIRVLAARLEKLGLAYSSRWMAVKLLEGDAEVEELVGRKSPSALSLAKKFRQKLEKCKRETCAATVTTEKYLTAKRLIDECQKIKHPETPPLESRLDSLLLHRVIGYVFLAIAGVLVFALVFSAGGLLSSALSDTLGGLKPLVTNAFEGLGGSLVADLVWSGVFEGVIAGLTIALPFLLPFFVLLSILESSGYLARMAFLMDNVMRKIGLHGKAFIPLLLGYGCSVPACLSCRIMEDERERITAGFVVTLVPCAARTVVILGLVGAFLGLKWALAIYVFNLLVVFLLGRLAFKVLPGEPMGLIMEMPPYRLPQPSSVLKETWGRLSDFVLVAFPVIIVSTFVITLLQLAGLTQTISSLLSPVTVGWLGLPAVVGIVLVFGILRKELTLIMLAAIFGTQNFASVFTPVQMIVFTLVTLFYIPCAATIAVLAKEFGWKKTVCITLFEIAFAVLLGGTAFRLLTALNIP